MADEKLIESVRKYEFLYNLQHPKYMDSVRKEMAWKEISEQLKQPAAACKQRWQGLRDAYRRALNKRAKSGHAAKKIKKWKYEEEMSFVTSFFAERKSLVSAELTHDDVESRQSNDAEAEIQKPHSDNALRNNTVIAMTCEDDITVGDKCPQLVSQAKKAKIIKRAKLRPQSGFAVLVSKLLEAQNKSSRGHDELDRFFLHISDTVKKFSPLLQAIAKKKIFSLVSEMELQQLAPDVAATAQCGSARASATKPEP